MEWLSIQRLSTKEVAFLVVFVSLSISTNYCLIGVPNVKFMDLLVFVSGVCFGCLMGALVGGLSWIIYGFFNPYGFCLPIWIATIMCEMIYGLAGGLVRRFGVVPRGLNPDFKGDLLIGGKLALVGFFSTLLYDVVTNLVFAVTFQINPVLALIQGVPFALVHELSNVLLFFTLAPVLMFAIKRVWR